MNKLRRTLHRVRIPALGLLAVGLAGCSMFGGPAVPKPLLPEQPVSLLHAPEPDNETPLFERNDAGHIQVFIPLRKARRVIDAVTQDKAASEYASKPMARAREMLHSAEKTWQSIASAPLSHKELLFLAANRAHRAMRYAQIARGMGKQHVSIKQLESARALLHKKAEATRAGADEG